MEELETELKTLSHHSYCIVGGAPIRDQLQAILEKDHGLKLQRNPDLFDRKYESLTIDDARELKEAHSMRPVSAAGKKIFILAMDSITQEAQNALLKLLEEPAEYAYFFLIIPSEHLLLPTVKSRLSMIRTTTGASGAKPGNAPADAASFLNEAPAKRLETVKILVDDISKDKKTKQDAVEFLDSVQAAVHAERGARNGKAALDAIETARKYMNDRAPSIKMLLEHVALSI